MVRTFTLLLDLSIHLQVLLITTVLTNDRISDNDMLQNLFYFPFPNLNFEPTPRERFSTPVVAEVRKPFLDFHRVI